MFRSMNTTFGDQFFTIDKHAFNINGSTPDVILSSHFFTNTLPVAKQAGGLFSSDLTANDDLLLAFLSLLLLLVIDGLVATILLRTREGRVSTFGFSVKQVIDLIRDFDLRRPSSYKETRIAERRHIRKIAIVAVLILLFSLGFEVLILFLTSPVYKKVTNKTGSFRILQPFIPSWGSVHFHARISMNQPCASMALSDVDQGRTRISACVTSSVGGVPLEFFEPVSSDAHGDIDAEIVSDYHEYGSEHHVTFDNVTSSFSVRAYFTLDDGDMRIMKSLRRPRLEKQLAGLVHRQFIAYAFTSYLKVVEDSEMNLSRLNSLKFPYREEEGPKIEILRTDDKTYLEKSRRYITKIRGMLPRGSPVLLFGQQFFRGMAKVSVEKPDEEDLFINKGKASTHAVLWRESVRAVNWLSLTIVLVISTSTFLVLRWRTKSVSIAEMAGIFVKQEVDANLLRSPIEVDRREKSHFRITPADMQAIGEYHYGTGTDNLHYGTAPYCTEY